MADETTIYSAKHWAAKAAKSATAAAGSKADVAANATAAATSAQTASEKAENAASSATSAAASATAAAGKATQAATSATNAGQSETAAAASATNAANSATAASSSATSAQTAQTKAQALAAKAAASAQEAAQSAQNARGLAIGQVVLSQSNLATDNPGCLPLWTGEYYANASTLYPDFYAWVKSHPELCKTKAEYNSAIATYGECPYYVADEEPGSLRLPKLSNYIKMAGAEGITQKGAGLPNLTWNLTVNEGYFATTCPEIVLSGSQQIAGGANWVSNVQADYSAQRGNPIYGNSDTVQPAHSTLYPWVCAFNAAVPASTAQAAEFTGALAGKANADLSNCPPNYDYVVEHYSDAQGNWCHKYKSGWLEQGGGYGEAFTDYRQVTITLLKPFKDTKYTLVHSNSSSGNSYEGVTTAKTVSTFSIFNATNKDGLASWEAKGQGAE